MPTVLQPRSQTIPKDPNVVSSQKEEEDIAKGMSVFLNYLSHQFQAAQMLTLFSSLPVSGSGTYLRIQ